jgi:bifunctional DNase/RNase
MKINLQVTYQGKPAKEITAIPADFVAFEMKFNMPITVLQKETRLTYLYFLAYSSEKRTGAIKDLDFEKWLETIEAVEGEEAKK